MSPAARERSFDELAQGLASGSLSRRKAMKLMGAALLGSALGYLPGGLAWANNPCPRGEARCNNRCVNLHRNERNCGRCGHRCASNKTCCGGNCRNLQTNERHCGSCSNRCAEGQECVDGVCSGGEPICDPPCPEGGECVEAGPGVTVCYPICDPPCTPGTACFFDQDGTTTYCVCGQGGCTDDCSVCLSQGMGATCALANPITGCVGAQYQCVTPVGVGEC